MTTKTLKTRIHKYRFNTENPAEKEAYQVLCTVLKQTPGRGHWLHALTEPSSRAEESEWIKEGAEIELETEHLFDNQWNTTCSHRVFDWYETIYPNKDIKAGHYLDITEEMVRIRETTFGCGYCGKQYTELPEKYALGQSATLLLTSGSYFCAACLDSPYLKMEDLHLLRLHPVTRRWESFPPLSAEELAELHPIYVHRQTTEAGSRAVLQIQKLRQEISAKRDRDVRRAEMEFSGMTWLMDHNVSTENVIYYSHNERFSFGWRNSGLDKAVAAELRTKLAGFPFPYDIKERGPHD